MKPSRFLLATMLAASFASAAPAAWKKELTSPAPGPHPRLAASVLEFKVSWKGIVNSGKVTMEFAPKGVKKPGALVVRSSATSFGAAAMVFPYQGNSWSEIHPVTLRPRFFQSTESNPEETVVTTTRFHRNRVNSQVVTRPRGKPAGTPRNKSFGFSPVFDIYSAILHIRSQKLAHGDRITLVIHPFNNPYLLRVEVLGREPHLGRAAIRLSVDMRKIDRDTLELKAYKKIRKPATLWLSDDADRIPVELRAAVFIGDVRATLSGFRKL